MIYPDNFENKIEFDAVRRMLKEYTLCSLGAERVDDMQFMTDFKAINMRLDEVVEFVRILQLEQNFPTCASLCNVYVLQVCTWARMNFFLFVVHSKQ